MHNQKRAQSTIKVQNTQRGGGNYKSKSKAGLTNNGSRLNNTYHQDDNTGGPVVKKVKMRNNATQNLNSGNSAHQHKDGPSGFSHTQNNTFSNGKGTASKGDIRHGSRVRVRL